MAINGETNDRDAASDTGSDEPQLGLLRQLLFGEEKQEIEQLKERLDDPELSARDVARVLAEAIRIRTGQDQQLGEALSPTISDAFDDSIKRNPRKLADAISPIMGPAIRRSIAHTIRGMVQSLNRALETSFSARGLKWRIEAWRTGKSFGEVVLLHTLVYQVEQVFLIHRESGLLLQHVAAASAAIKDTDMVSGMLTAIQDFVVDSFGGSDQESLEALQVGEFTVWVEQGADAVLAAVIRGQPPEDFRTTLSEVIETVHLEQGDALADFDGDATGFEHSRPALETCLQSQYRHSSPAKSPKKAIFALGFCAAAILLLVGYFGYRNWQERQRWNECIALFRAEPGFVVTDAERRGGNYFLAGLRDPLARNPDTVLSASEIGADRVEYRWKPFQSFDGPLALQRARKLLQPPATIEVKLSDTVLSFRGDAPSEWMDMVRLLAPIIPGVDSIDISGVNIPESPLDELVVALRRQPGLAITSAEHRDGVFFIEGTRSKNSADLASVLEQLGLKPSEVRFRWRSPDELDSEFVLNRARRVLRPPPEVQVKLQDNVLHLSGTAPKAWTDLAQQLALAIPGISSVDTTALVDADATWQAYLDRLKDEPGIVVTSAERRGEKYFVAGLHDPLARDPRQMMAEFGLDASHVTFSFEPYQSLTRRFILLRATNRLQPPESVSLDFAGGILQIRGKAANGWIRRALPEALTLAGISSVDSAALVDLDLQAFSELKGEIEKQVLYFEGGATELVSESQERLQQLAAKVKQLLVRANTLAQPVTVEITGHAANQGDAEFIQQVSQRRAEQIGAALVSLGVPETALKIKAAGASQPHPSGESESDFAIHRRVTLKVVGLSAKLPK